MVVLLVSFVNRLVGCCVPLPIPTDVCNVVVLFLYLDAKVVGLSSIGSTNGFLVRVVPLVFVPTNINLVSS